MMTKSLTSPSSSQLVSEALICFTTMDTDELVEERAVCLHEHGSATYAIG